MAYNLTGWLEKNKDPLNDTVVDQFKKGSNALAVEIFADHPGQSAPADAGGKGTPRTGTAAAQHTLDSSGRQHHTLGASHSRRITSIGQYQSTIPDTR